MRIESQIIEADLTFIDGQFKSGVQVEVLPNGLIGTVGRIEEPVTHRLKRAALMPGMVNAHSHAFQRGLRGHGETFAHGRGSFWTWREAMYRLVDRMDEQLIYELSKQTFDEMLLAGVTTVGEFHYLHHDGSNTGYAFDEIVLRAAGDAGIRIVLLNALYCTGGIDKPLQGGQLRFGSVSRDTYWRQMDHLAAGVNLATQSLGTVVHSIRAVCPDDLAAVADEASHRGMVLHMHVEEQQREIVDCIGAYGKTPMAILNEVVTDANAVTAVHCTHTSNDDLKRFMDRGGSVCICPLTEANLGDGIADVALMCQYENQLCLGTDSNARISMQEEMRWLEYGQRLKHQRRGVCVDSQGAVGRQLWTFATINGAASLGLHAGQIAHDMLADFVVVGLDAPPLRGIEADSLLDAMILGASHEIIEAVCVGGSWLHMRGERYEVPVAAQ